MNSHFGQTHGRDRDELLDDLRRLAEDLGKTPSQSDVLEHGRFGVSTYEREFGSWNDAIVGADLEPIELEISEEEVLNDLQVVADEIGEPPTAVDYAEHGQYNKATVFRKFDSWNDALVKAGFERQSAFGLSDDEVRECLKDVIVELGRAPTRDEFDEMAPISAATVQRRLGWTETIRELGYEPAQYAPDREELLAEIQRLHDEHDRVTVDVMDEHGRFDSMTYFRRFDSWKEAVVEAGFEEPSKGIPGEDHPHWNGGHSGWRGSNWTSIRAEVRSRDDHECRVCGEPAVYERGASHQVHHITPFGDHDDHEEANSLDNLVLLCISCHRSLEGRWTDLDINEWVERARDETLSQ